jgi:hypothetical protein
MEVYIPNKNANIMHIMTEEDFNANLTCTIFSNPIIDNSIHSVIITSITVVDNLTDFNVKKVFMYVLADNEPAYIISN